MIQDILLPVLGAFIGSIGFALLVQAPLRSLLPSGIIAALTYLVYSLIAFAGVSEALAVFAGALFGSLAGQWVARRMKMIGTVFLMSAIVPVVPGLGLYRMMTLLGQGATAAGADQGIQAMITIAMIALGLGFGSFTDRRFHPGKKK
ncbi:MAG: threonine/serine exporter family protein [Clostridia bacterium]|nr:threonine/serine exporter family protein [Clostridia bacterium]